MKWYSTDPNGPTFDYSQPDAMLAWCNANNIPVRGHNIFWDIPEVQQVSILVNITHSAAIKLVMKMYIFCKENGKVA
jgi:GH35 family endo-1,4-beta-xylanase